MGKNWLQNSPLIRVNLRTDILDRYKCTRIHIGISQSLLLLGKTRNRRDKDSFPCYLYICITSPCLQHIKLISTFYWHNSCGPGHMLVYIKSLINRNYYFLAATSACKGKSSQCFLHYLSIMTNFTFVKWYLCFLEAVGRFKSNSCYVLSS